MSPQPALDTDSIIEQLNDFMVRYTPPSTFELAKLDMDISRIGNVDIALSQCFRGVYYALQGDLVNTTKWFNMALSISPTNPDVYMNYSASLCRLGQHDQAIKMALEAINKGGYTPQTLHNLILSAYNAEDHALLEEWLPKYEELTGSSHAAVLWLQEDAEDEAEVARLRDEIRSGPCISLDQIRKELEL